MKAEVRRQTARLKLESAGGETLQSATTQCPYHLASLCHQLPLVTCPHLAHYEKHAVGAIYENIC